MYLSVAPMYGGVQQVQPLGMNIPPTNIGMFPSSPIGMTPFPTTQFPTSTMNIFPTPGQFPGMGRQVPIQVPGQFQQPIGTKQFPGQGLLQNNQECPSDEDFQREVENDPAINQIIDQVISQIPPEACGVRPPQHRREERVVASTCPPRTAVIRRRLPSPEPDIVERTTIVRAPQDIVNIVIEKPGMPPPCVYETTDYEPEAPPRIQQGVVCVQPSSQCPPGAVPDEPQWLQKGQRYPIGMIPRQTGSRLIPNIPWSSQSRLVPQMLPGVVNVPSMYQQQQLPMVMLPQTNIIGSQMYQPYQIPMQYSSSILGTRVNPLITNRLPTVLPQSSFQQYPSSQVFGSYSYTSQPSLVGKTISYPMMSSSRVMPSTSLHQPTVSTQIPNLQQGYYWPQTSSY